MPGFTASRKEALTDNTVVLGAWAKCVRDGGVRMVAPQPTVSMVRTAIGFVHRLETVDGIARHEHNFLHGGAAVKPKDLHPIAIVP